MSDSSLLDFITCEELDRDLFRGQSKDFKTGQVFGGQVLGQAIKAAYQTVPGDRNIHSAHAYFLLRGDVDAPIIYEVDRSLDGGSYSSRRVVAKQHGRQIFHLSASFQKKEDGLEYYRSWVPPVDYLNESIKRGVPERHNFQAEFLDVCSIPKDQRTQKDAVQFWMKTKEKLPDDLRAHHSVLAYVSDMGLLLATLTPHDLDEPQMEKRLAKMLMATLDHAIWFHRPFRADDWLFYECRPQSTGNGRGLAMGRIYSQDGTLVASTSQEGVMRIRRN